MATKRKPKKSAAPKRERGRPSSYKPEYAEQAQRLCEQLGATDEDLASFFLVTITTIKNWKATHPEFLASTKIGKAVADERVEQSLYRRATGYSFDSEKIFMPAGAKSPVRAPISEHVPPDVTAQIFWLKNRKSKDWRDKSEVEVTGDLAAALAKARTRAGRTTA